MKNYPFIISVNEGFRVSEKDIESIEKEFSIVFPENMKVFYLEYNGCTTEPCFFVSDKNDQDENGFIISSIVPIRGKNEISQELYLEQLMRWDFGEDYMPRPLIPFALDEGGDSYYCDPQTNEVWIYHGEFIDDPILLANSFQDFLDGIKVGNLYDLL